MRRPLRIGIDLHTVNHFMQGSRTYIWNVTQKLLEIDKESEYYLYFARVPDRLPDVFASPTCHIRRIFPASRALRLTVGFPLALARDRIDVFHCQYMGPPLMRTPYVVTLHDILHEIYPQYYPPALRRFMHLTYPYSARRAAKVLTVSEFSKDAIVRLYGIPEEKMLVTHDAVSEAFRPVADRAAVARALARCRIPSSYILTVGRLEPRKNIPGLIRAYHALKRTGRFGQKLVIVGMHDFSYHEIHETIRALALQEDVILTGRVEDADLPLVINGADLFVYPSFAEGFGIPPLEAMACGVPVITSNTTSLPEVVGDAGLTVDPGNKGELVDAMERALSLPELRSRMIAAGLTQAARFSWRTTAERVLAAYREVAGRR